MNQVINGMSPEEQKQEMADLHAQMSLEEFSDTPKTMVVTSNQFAVIMIALEIAGEL